MKKRLCIVSLLFLFVLILAACGEETPPSHTRLYCEHNFIEANCFHPKTCRYCGIKEGEPLQHIWEEATCLAPKRCTLCRLVDGDVEPHNFVDHFCDFCGLMLPSEGLEFTLNWGGMSYSLAGLGTCQDSVIYVPATYCGLPVDTIKAEIFEGTHQVTGIWLSENIWNVPRLHGLESIFVVEENRNLDHHEGVLYAENYVELIQYPEARVGEYTLPETVWFIRDEAFRDCRGLEAVHIQEGVQFIGNHAFANCTALREIHLPGSLNTLGEEAFSNCSALEIVSFANADSDGGAPSWSDAMPNSGLNLGHAAFFGCTALHTVTLPDHLRSLGQRAFEACTSLSAITIPSQVAFISERCFAYCKALETVELPEGLSIVEAEAFDSCKAIKEMRLPDTVRLIQTNAFRNCTGLETVILPECLEKIHSYAFAMCTSLRQVTFNENLQGIFAGAFYGCSALESVQLPESLKFIKTQAFFETGLKQVSLPNGIETIEYHAFGNNPYLEYQKYGNGLYLGNAENPYLVLMLAANESITECRIHPDTYMIGANSFANCRDLTSVTIPAKVRIVGNRAFSECSALSRVEIQASDSSALSIGYCVFYLCENLKEITYGGSRVQWVTSVVLDPDWAWGSGITKVIAEDVVIEIP